MTERKAKARAKASGRAMEISMHCLAARAGQTTAVVVAVVVVDIFPTGKKAAEVQGKQARSDHHEHQSQNRNQNRAVVVVAGVVVVVDAVPAVSSGQQAHSLTALRFAAVVASENESAGPQRRQRIETGSARRGFAAETLALETTARKQSAQTRPHARPPAHHTPTQTNNHEHTPKRKISVPCTRVVDTQGRRAAPRVRCRGPSRDQHRKQRTSGASGRAHVRVNARVRVIVM